MFVLFGGAFGLDNIICERSVRSPSPSSKGRQVALQSPSGSSWRALPSRWLIRPSLRLQRMSCLYRCFDSNELGRISSFFTDFISLHPFLFFSRLQILNLGAKMESTPEGQQQQVNGTSPEEQQQLQAGSAPSEMNSTTAAAQQPSIPASKFTFENSGGPRILQAQGLGLQEDEQQDHHLRRRGQ